MTREWNMITVIQGRREARRTAVSQWRQCETGSRSAFRIRCYDVLQPAPIVLARTMEIFLTCGALPLALVAPMVGWLNFARMSPPPPPLPLPHHVQCTSRRIPSPSVISRTNGYRRSVYAPGTGGGIECRERVRKMRDEKENGNATVQRRKRRTVTAAAAAPRGAR